MPRIERSATISWEGNVARGVGHITGDTGAFTDLPFSLPTRIGAAEGKTSPEELLAAAHGGCFTMSLAGELSAAGTPPERLDVRATVVMDEVDGHHRIVASHLEANGRVPGIDAETFARALDEADGGCPFSALIRASGNVTVSGQLEV